MTFLSKFLLFFNLIKSTTICIAGGDPKILAELEKTLAEKQSKNRSLKVALQAAIESRNVDNLEKAIDAFKAAGLTQVSLGKRNKLLHTSKDFNTL